MKNELEKVREWAEARIKSGDAPEWSWEHHVKLIEAVDAVLHDIAMVSDASKPRRRLGGARHLVERADAHTSSGMTLARKAGALH